MVNPLPTIVFDVLLVGTATALFAAVIRPMASAGMRAGLRRGPARWLALVRGGTRLNGRRRAVPLAARRRTRRAGAA